MGDNGYFIHGLKKDNRFFEYTIILISGNMKIELA